MLPDLDPDDLAFRVAHQFLQEHGYCKALVALEVEAGRQGLTADTSPLPASQLLQWCYRHVEEAAAQLGDDLDDEASARRRLEEHLLRTAPPDFPAVLASTMPSLSVNPCSVACWPEGDRLVAGLANGEVQTWSRSGTLLASGVVEGVSGVLTLSLATHNSGAGLVAAGCMDGSVCVLDGENNGVLCSSRAHRKYAVAVRWAQGGRYLVSGGWDNTVNVSHVEACPEGAWTLSLLHSEACPGQVLDICVLPGSARFLVATRGSNYLQEFEIAQGEAGSDAPPKVKLRGRHNLNPLGDDHVSFAAMRLALSPCGAFLLVAADSGRLLIYDLAAFRQVRMLFLSIESTFHHHCIAWHRSGCFLMAAAAHGVVSVFEVATGREVSHFKAHAKAVRDMTYLPHSNELVTCSFDKCINVWTAAENDDDE